MQTFLPEVDYSLSASRLDRLRLGKQRVETMQIMSAFTRTSGGWVNHPATKMWKGYGWALLQYQRGICWEWSHIRGYKDTCLDKTTLIYEHLPEELKNIGIYPPWTSLRELYESHRSNLIRKNPEHYKPFWPNTPDNLEYIWPMI